MCPWNAKEVSNHFPPLLSMAKPSWELVCDSDLNREWKAMEEAKKEKKRKKEIYYALSELLKSNQFLKDQ